MSSKGALFPGDHPTGKRVSVYWDGLGLDNPASGIYRHAARLADALASHQWRPVIVCHPSAKTFPDHEKFNIEDGPLGQRMGLLKPVWAERVYERLRSSNAPKGSILHAHSNFNLSQRNACHSYFSTVLTVHDLIPLIAPTSVSKALYLQMKVLLPRLLQKAGAIVTVSQWTRKELTKRFGISPERVEVIPNGIDGPKFSPERPQRSIRNILSIARFEPYKRLELIPEILARGSDLIGTVVTNERGREWFASRHQELIKKGRLRVLTSLSDAELKGIWDETAVYVHPSRFEGFGLPVAEALAQGVPVVYCQGSAVSEAAATQGIGLLPEADPQDWLKIIENLAPKVNDTAYLSSLAADLGQRPGWDDAARKIIKVYDNLINNQ